MSENYDAYSTYYDMYTNVDNYVKIIVDRMNDSLHRVCGRGFEGASVLDAACGTGNSMISLMNYTDDVTGFDSSYGMLAKAQGKTDREGLPLSVFSANLEHFDTERKYNYITCIYGSVNHLTSLDALISFLKCARRSLFEDGAVVIDTNTKMIYEHYWKHPCVEFISKDHVLYREPIERFNALHSIKVHSLNATGDPDIWSALVTVMTERFYSVDDIILASSQADLKISSIFGISSSDSLSLEPRDDLDNRFIYILTAAK